MKALAGGLVVALALSACGPSAAEYRFCVNNVSAVQAEYGGGEKGVSDEDLRDYFLGKSSAPPSASPTLTPFESQTADEACQKAASLRHQN